MSDEVEYKCDHLNITYTNKNGALTLLLRYKIYYKTREIRFHFRFPEPNQLRDREKSAYPNLIFWTYLEDLRVLNGHIYYERTQQIVYIHHDRPYFSALVTDCVSNRKSDPDYQSAQAEFEKMMIDSFGLIQTGNFYYSPRSTPSPHISSPQLPIVN